MTFTRAELATILAALRLLQHDIADNGIEPLRNMAQFNPSPGEVPIEPLDITRIDDLCERLNASVAFMIQGPDGFPLDPDTYRSLDEAIQAAAAFPLRYAAQGYYVDSSRNQIPIDQLPRLLHLVEVEH